MVDQDNDCPFDSRLRSLLKSSFEDSLCDFYFTQLISESEKLCGRKLMPADNRAIYFYSIVKNWMVRSNSEYLNSKLHELYHLLYSVIVAAEKTNSSLLPILAKENELTNFLCEDLSKSIAQSLNGKHILRILMLILKAKATESNPQGSELIAKALLHAVQASQDAGERTEISNQLAANFESMTQPAKESISKLLIKDFDSGFDKKSASLEVASAIVAHLTEEVSMQVITSALELSSTRAPPLYRIRAFAVIEKVFSVRFFSFEFSQKTIEELIDLGENSVLIDPNSEQIIPSFIKAQLQVLMNIYSLAPNKSKNYIPATIALLFELFSADHLQSNAKKYRSLAEKSFDMLIEKCFDYYFLSELDEASLGGLEDLLDEIDINNPALTSSQGKTNLEKIFSLFLYSLGEKFAKSRSAICTIITQMINKITSLGFNKSGLFNNYLVLFFKAIEPSSELEEEEDQMELEKPEAEKQEDTLINDLIGVSEQKSIRRLLSSIIQVSNLSFFLSKALKVQPNISFLERDFSKPLELSDFSGSQTLPAMLTKLSTPSAQTLLSIIQAHSNTLDVEPLINTFLEAYLYSVVVLRNNEGKLTKDVGTMDASSRLQVNQKQLELDMFTKIAEGFSRLSSFSSLIECKQIRIDLSNSSFSIAVDFPTLLINQMGDCSSKSFIHIAKTLQGFLVSVINSKDDHSKKVLGEVLKEKGFLGKMAKVFGKAEQFWVIVLENLIKLSANLLPLQQVQSIIARNTERLTKSFESGMAIEEDSKKTSKTNTEAKILICIVSSMSNISTNSDLFHSQVQLSKLLLSKPESTVTGFKLLIALQQAVASSKSHSTTLLEIAEQKASGFLQEKMKDLRFNKWCLRFLQTHLNAITVNGTKQIGEKELGFLVQSFVPFVVFCMRHRSEKVRNIAESIVGIFTKDVFMSSSEAPEENSMFLAGLIAGLAGSTADMKICSVHALKHVFASASEHLSKSYRESLLQVMILMIKEKHKETYGAVLDFIRIFCKKCDAEEVEEQLELIIEAVFQWDEEKARELRVVVKTLLHVLIKKVNYEELLKLVPEEFSKLLKNVNHQIRHSENKSKKSKDKTGQPRPQKTDQTETDDEDIHIDASSKKNTPSFNQDPRVSSKDDRPSPG